MAKEELRATAEAKENELEGMISRLKSKHFKQKGLHQWYKNRYHMLWEKHEEGEPKRPPKDIEKTTYNGD